MVTYLGDNKKVLCIGDYEVGRSLTHSLTHSLTASLLALTVDTMLPWVSGNVGETAVLMPVRLCYAIFVLASSSERLMHLRSFAIGLSESSC